MGNRSDAGAKSSDAGFENSVKKNQNKKNKFTDLTKDVTNPNDDTEAKASLFREAGVTEFRNREYKPPIATLLGEVLAPASRYNRDFFKNEVLGKGGFKNTSKKDFERKTVTEQEKIYGNYFSDRQSGKVDAYGNLSPNYSVENVAHRNKDGTMTTRQVTMNRNGDGSKSLEQPKVASQMDNSDVKSSMIMADKTAPTDIEFTQDQSALETKKRGRKRTILTSVTGDTSNVTLGKKTLLGS